ncbi:MAG: hypothetical protein IPQ03_12520 [Bacteroidetes bacterium]|nr:hypothetical protein [Bacteroidota bacterium]
MELYSVRQTTVVFCKLGQQCTNRAIDMATNVVSTIIPTTLVVMMELHVTVRKLFRDTCGEHKVVKFDSAFLLLRLRLRPNLSSPADIFITHLEHSPFRIRETIG